MHVPRRVMVTTSFLSFEKLILYALMVHVHMMQRSSNKNFFESYIYVVCCTVLWFTIPTGIGLKVGKKTIAKSVQSIFVALLANIQRKQFGLKSYGLHLKRIMNSRSNPPLLKVCLFWSCVYILFCSQENNKRWCVVHKEIVSVFLINNSSG